MDEYISRYEEKTKRYRTARDTLHKLENRGIIENNLSTEQITAIRIAEFALDELCKSKDVQPVKCGEWGNAVELYGVKHRKCSCCNYAVTMEEADEFDVCPKCGARISGDTE